jgi:hypothetical protein
VKKRESIEELLKLFKDDDLRPPKALNARERIRTVLTMLRGRPVLDYSKDKNKFIVSGGTQECPSGSGRVVLLDEYVYHLTIKCLESFLNRKRGAPKKDEYEQLSKAVSDRCIFEVVRETLLRAGIKAPATRAYQILGRKWVLTNRQVRNRIATARKYHPMSDVVMHEAMQSYLRKINFDLNFWEKKDYSIPD